MELEFVTSRGKEKRIFACYLLKLREVDSNVQASFFHIFQIQHSWRIAIN